MNPCNHFNPSIVPIHVYSIADNSLLRISHACAECATRALLPVKEDLLPAFQLPGFDSQIYADIPKAHYTLKRSCILSSLYLLTKVFLADFAHFYINFFKDRDFEISCIWARNNIYQTTYLDRTFKLGLNEQIRKILADQGEKRILETVTNRQLFEDRFSKILIFSTTLFFLLKMNRGINRKEFIYGATMLISHSTLLLVLNRLFQHSAESLVYGNGSSIDLDVDTMNYAVANSGKQISHYFFFAVLTIGILGMQVKNLVNRIDRVERQVNNPRALEEILNNLARRKITLSSFSA